MTKTIISPKELHKPLSYSQGIKTGKTIYLAGQTATDSQGHLVGKGDIGAQTVQACENIKATLTAAGATLDDVVRVNVFITRREDMLKMSEAKKHYFKEPYPASTLLVVSSLAQSEYLVEIEATAVLD